MLQQIGLGEVLRGEQQLVLLDQGTQEAVVDLPIGEARQMRAAIRLELEDQHEQERKLSCGLGDVAARLVEMEPGEAAAVDAQVVPQCREELGILRLLTFELGPQAVIGQAVQVLSCQEVREQVGQRGQAAEFDGRGRVHRPGARSMSCG